MKLKEKLIKSEISYVGNMLEILDDTVELPNGATSRRDVIRHPGAAVILPITEDNKILLVEQYRHPVGKVTIEVPAGKVDSCEYHFMTAKRELLEETGYSSAEIEYVDSLYPVWAYCDEEMHFYVARNCKKISDLNLDSDEFINVREVTISEFNNLDIKDLKTQYIVQKIMR